MIPQKKGFLPPIASKEDLNNLNDLDDLLDDIQPKSKPKPLPKKTDPWGNSTNQASGKTNNNVNTEEQFFEGGEDDHDPWTELANNEDIKNARVQQPYSQSRATAPS